MARKSAYFKEVERLLKIGYEPTDIIKMTGIPKSTVYRLTEKLQAEGLRIFKRTMSHDFIWKYQMNMENISQTIQQLNEEMVICKAKYDEIESDIDQAIELLSLPKQSSVHANLLMAKISCQSSRTNELIKLTAQRDKATESKAKLFNQGPVVNAVHEWVNSSPPPMGQTPHLELPKPPELNSNQILIEEEAEERRIQEEMETDF